jgi:hypothetical protein
VLYTSKTLVVQNRSPHIEICGDFFVSEQLYIHNCFLYMASNQSFTFRHAVDTFLNTPADYDGKVSDDFPYSREDITNHLLDQRVLIIQQAKNERGEISDAMRQVLRCIPMERVDRVECPCAPPSGCYWARSITPIPTTMMVNYVSDIQGNDSFLRTSWAQVKYLKRSRIKSKRSKRHYLFRENGEGATNLYVLLPSPLPGQAQDIPMFTLAGVFQDPIAVAQYPDCRGNQSAAVCNPLDVPFFTDRGLRPIIFASTWNMLIRAKQSAPVDNVNNDVSDKTEVKKMKQ